MRAMKKMSMMVVALACVGALGGCAGQGTLSDAIDEATGAYTITADDAGKGSALLAIEGLDIKEGQVLSIDSDLSKGSLQVRIVDATGKAVVDEEEKDVASAIYELDPGSYTLGVNCNEDGTTGTVVVSPEGELSQK